MAASRAAMYRVGSLSGIGEDSPDAGRALNSSLASSSGHSSTHEVADLMLPRRAETREGAAAASSGRAADEALASSSAAAKAKLRPKAVGHRTSIATATKTRSRLAAAAAAGTSSGRPDVTVGFGDLMQIAAVRRQTASALRVLPRREIEQRDAAFRERLHHLFDLTVAAHLTPVHHDLQRRRVVHAASSAAVKLSALAIVNLVELRTRIRDIVAPAISGADNLHLESTARLQEMAAAHEIMTRAIRTWRARRDRRRQLDALHRCRAYRAAQQTIAQALPPLWLWHRHMKRARPQQQLRDEYWAVVTAESQVEQHARQIIVSDALVAQHASAARQVADEFQRSLPAVVEQFAVRFAGVGLPAEEFLQRVQLLCHSMANEHRLLLRALRRTFSQEEVVLSETTGRARIMFAEVARRARIPRSREFVAAMAVQRWLRVRWAVRYERAGARLFAAERSERRSLAAQHLLTVSQAGRVSRFASASLELHGTVADELLYRYTKTSLAGVDACLLGIHMQYAVDLFAHMRQLFTAAGESHRAAALATLQRCGRGATERWARGVARVVTKAEFAAREAIVKRDMQPAPAVDLLRRVAKGAQRRTVASRFHRTCVVAEPFSRSTLVHAEFAEREAVYRQRLSDEALEGAWALRAASRSHAILFWRRDVDALLLAERMERAAAALAWERWVGVCEIEGDTISRIAACERRLRVVETPLRLRVAIKDLRDYTNGMDLIIAEEASAWRCIIFADRHYRKASQVFRRSCDVSGIDADNSGNTVTDPHLLARAREFMRGPPSTTVAPPPAGAVEAVTTAVAVGDEQEARAALVASERVTRASLRMLGNHARHGIDLVAARPTDIGFQQILLERDILQQELMAEEDDDESTSKKSVADGEPTTTSLLPAPVATTTPSQPRPSNLKSPETRSSSRMVSISEPPVVMSFDNTVGGAMISVTSAEAAHNRMRHSSALADSTLSRMSNRDDFFDENDGDDEEEEEEAEEGGASSGRADAMRGSRSNMNESVLSRMSNRDDFFDDEDEDDEGDDEHTREPPASGGAHDLNASSGRVNGLLGSQMNDSVLSHMSHRDDFFDEDDDDEREAGSTQEGVVSSSTEEDDDDDDDSDADSLDYDEVYWV